MALELYTSTQLATNSSDIPRTIRPTSDHGKLRVQYFEVSITVQGDDGSEFDLCDLPPGATRIIPSMCRLNHTAFAAGRTIDIGFREYRTTSNTAVDAQPEDLEALVAGFDIAAAGEDVQFSTVSKYDVFSKQEIRVAAKVSGGAIPNNGTLSGFIAYVYE